MDTLIYAACAFELSADKEGWIQVLPAGTFKPNDGRKMAVPHWYIDAKSAAKLIDNFKQQKNKLVIDYEHQTLYKEKNGQPAPAAAWMVDLQWREGSGLWAKTEYTPQAAQQIKDKQYRYFSPVFNHDNKGVIKNLINGGLTNTPAIDGMAELAAAARRLFEQPEDNTMSDKPTESKADLSAIASALHLDKGADEQTIIAACSALKEQVGKTQTPDPAEYMPVAAMKEMQAQIAALSAQIQSGEADNLIAAAKQQGKLLPAQEQWAKDYASKDLQGFKAYLESVPAIAALTQMQAKEPPKNDLGLTAEEIRAAKATGTPLKEFAEFKKAQLQSEE